MKTLVKEVHQAVASTNFVVSSMTGSLKAPWTFSGKKVHWISMLACPVAGPSISLASLHDTVRITGMSNTGSFPEIRELVKGIEQELSPRSHRAAIKQ